MNETNTCVDLNKLIHCHWYLRRRLVTNDILVVQVSIVMVGRRYWWRLIDVVAATLSNYRDHGDVRRVHD